MNAPKALQILKFEGTAIDWSIQRDTPKNSHTQKVDGENESENPFPMWHIL